MLFALTILVGLDVTLIPGNTKWRLRRLDDEIIEIRVRGKTLYRDIHDLNGPVGRDPDGGAGVRETGFGSRRNDHIEFDRVVIGRHQRRDHCKQSKSCWHCQSRELCAHCLFSFLETICFRNKVRT
jgi:hypothetical protein